MYLLNTASLQLEAFADDEIPKYAILSHTWGKEEVSFQEIRQGGLNAQFSTPSGLLEKSGYAKIRASCKKALEENLSHIWIDTCCIDKTSSAELTEAINSMYKWYENSEVCYAFFSDIPDEEDHKGGNSGFSVSRWFTRGWTLQELLASPSVTFYSQGWQRIGTKVDLVEEISAITGVDIEVLKGGDPRSMSIAKRMSWASKRKTTRQEDIAYCLMGLFNVNMPLLYGEGEKAFIRLQEEIMKNSDDHSLFAWKELTEPVERQYRGLLAPSPAHFFASQNIVPIGYNPRNVPYSITNRGLRMDLSLLKIPETDLYLAPLNCTDITNYSGPEVIILGKLRSQDDDQFIRIHQRENPTSIVGMKKHDQRQKKSWYSHEDSCYPVVRKTIYVPQNPMIMQLQARRRLSRVYGFHIRQTPDSGVYDIVDILPREGWGGEARTLWLVDQSIGIAGSILFANQRKDEYFVLTVGVDVNFLVRVRIQFLPTMDQWKETCERHEELMERDVSGLRAGSGQSRNDSLAFKDVDRIYGFGRIVIEATVTREMVGEREMYVINLAHA